MLLMIILSNPPHMCFWTKLLSSMSSTCCPSVLRLDLVLGGWHGQVRTGKRPSATSASDESVKPISVTIGSLSLVTTDLYGCTTCFHVALTLESVKDVAVLAVLFVSSQVDLLLSAPPPPHFLVIVPLYVLLGRCSVILS